MFTINGKKIKRPFPFDIERYNITEAVRVASGDMQMDLIAKKRKFLLAYEVLSGAEYDYLRSLIDTDEVFFTFGYLDNGRQESAVVYAGPIRAKLHRTSMGWYWRDVTVNFIER